MQPPRGAGEAEGFGWLGEPSPAHVLPHCCPSGKQHGSPHAPFSKLLLFHPLLLPKAEQWPRTPGCKAGGEAVGSSSSFTVTSTGMYPAQGADNQQRSQNPGIKPRKKKKEPQTVLIRHRKVSPNIDTSVRRPTDMQEGREPQAQGERPSPQIHPQ